MFHNESAIRQLLRVFLGEVVLIGLMLAGYAVFGKFTVAVLLGALVGGVLAIGNFLFLSISVTRAADQAEKTGNAAKATLSVRASSTGRLLVLAVLYIVILKTGYFDPIASVLPLIFVQLSLNLTEYFRKDGEKEK